jgi:hypothetical protein
LSNVVLVKAIEVIAEASDHNPAAGNSPPAAELFSVADSIETDLLVLPA